MAALSKNTASVAQDFHNAGGDEQLNINFVIKNLNLYKLIENLNYHRNKKSSFEKLMKNENISPPAHKI